MAKKSAQSGFGDTSLEQNQFAFPQQESPARLRLPAEGTQFLLSGGKDWAVVPPGWPDKRQNQNARSLSFIPVGFSSPSASVRKAN
jgi:hypothetical protein